MATLLHSWAAAAGSSAGVMIRPLFGKLLLAIRRDQWGIYSIQVYSTSGEQIYVKFFSKSTTPSSSNTPRSAKPKSSRPSAVSFKFQSNLTAAGVSSSPPRRR